MWNTFVVYKSVHQYFNSEYYLKKQTKRQMQYISDGRISSQFMEPKNAGLGQSWYTPVQTLLVRTNKVNFFTNPFFDFTNFSDLLNFVGQKMDYYSTSISPSGSIVDWYNIPTKGIYLVQIQQDMMKSSSDISLLSLDDSLALVGGYAATVWLLIGFLFAGFSAFAYRNSLVREFVK